MLISGKVTSSFIKYFEESSLKWEEHAETVGLIPEVLKDTETWLPAEPTERFLELLDKSLHGVVGIPSQALLSQTVGHQAYELKAWGVLDKVLPLLKKPEDILSQPKMFMGYFISPAPPSSVVHRAEDSLVLTLPISSMEFPMICGYIASALEAIPAFMGESMALCGWKDTELKVNWSQRQSSLLKKKDQEKQVSKEMVEELLVQISQLNQDIHELKTENKKLTQSKNPKAPIVTQYTLDQVQNQLSKLDDYFLRARQLVELLSGDRPPRKNFVTQALLRTRWAHIPQNYPKVVRELKSLLKGEARDANILDKENSFSLTSK